MYRFRRMPINIAPYVLYKWKERTFHSQHGIEALKFFDSFELVAAITVGSTSRLSPPFSYKHWQHHQSASHNILLLSSNNRYRASTSIANILFDKCNHFSCHLVIVNMHWQVLSMYTLRRVAASFFFCMSSSCFDTQSRCAPTNKVVVQLSQLCSNIHHRALGSATFVAFFTLHANKHQHYSATAYLWDHSSVIASY